VSFGFAHTDIRNEWSLESVTNELLLQILLNSRIIGDNVVWHQYLFLKDVADFTLRVLTAVILRIAGVWSVLGAGHGFP
jgi:hypothetical protein